MHELRREHLIAMVLEDMIANLGGVASCAAKISTVRALMNLSRI